jgi:hypothetical protein
LTVSRSFPVCTGKAVSSHVCRVGKLRGLIDEPRNSLDTGKLDIAVDTKPGDINALSVLVLGGTGAALGFDYSPENIEAARRQALQTRQSGKPKRLLACARAATPNPLEGFEGSPPN